MSILEYFQYQNDSFQSDIFVSDIGITNVDVICRISPTLGSTSMPTYAHMYVSLIRIFCIVSLHVLYLALYASIHS